ncbi:MULTISPECIES: alpha/beta fold hydrolase [unclassified Streptomyces]|uniref:Alpha/beta hydrolase n=1 Tax=Streptomyces sp. NBC_00119 TaxID=2975659 RepID=A0AAU1U2B3_9ACTN|nr:MULTISPECIES: alpha/beta hydrolase [unclassified Streptomyces]MCX5435642.1 alpha/beta hydrolase [Streptomyces sp. NBC_00063]WSE08826.1 alpha/beta hydrolase [Streptomyces sp. NBC_01445]WSE13438.1 alpha/beta hydrolase [Streptomyces sp. NBC_01397]WUB97646.1 alpha/beta hydrolase [Streptomyces sp. NBC_00569]
MLQDPLVLIPALGSDARLWQPVIDHLHERLEVECLVIRGVGDSIESMADSILAQAPDRFCLAGISMGGYVALDIVLREPERVVGLALLNTSAFAAPPDRKKGGHQAISLTESGHFAEAVRNVSGAVAPGRPEVTAVAATMAHDLGADVFKAQQLAVLNRDDRTMETPGIKAPTLIVAGDADAITPLALSEEMAGSVPNAQLHVLEGVGHLSTLEAPALVASHLADWLLRTDDQERRRRS